MQEGRGNFEFRKVMDILKDDGELRPLIFEHEMLLEALLKIHDLKAEFMLSILTAAETEMFENSKQREETAELNERLGKILSERDNLAVAHEKAISEIKELQRTKVSLQQENETLQQEVEIEKARCKALERESECTFKNQQDEIASLKRLLETLKKSESDLKRQLKSQENEMREEIEGLKARVKREAQFKEELLEEKDMIERDLLEKDQKIVQL